ncbi:MAG: hypothetical protein Q9M30_06740, partial [Mariprofundaceae bacterium]|nr:hypothetical protein [Mariprofundaceae bacterium]
HEDMQFSPVPWLWFVISIALAWLMVSNVPFFAGKDVDLKQRKPAITLVVMLALIAFVMVNPHTWLFVLVLAYCIHGLLVALTGKHKKDDGNDGHGADDGATGAHTD